MRLMTLTMILAGCRAKAGRNVRCRGGGFRIGTRRRLCYEGENHMGDPSKLCGCTSGARICGLAFRLPRALGLGKQVWGVFRGKQNPALTRQAAGNFGGEKFFKKMSPNWR